MSDLEELPRQLEELRELIREAHGVIKDGTRLLREIRQASAATAEQARAAAHDAAVAEMAAFQVHIQRDMDRSARDLNRAVEAARVQVVKALTVKMLETGPDGTGIVATFGGNLFDDGSPAGQRGGPR